MKLFMDRLAAFVGLVGGAVRYTLRMGKDWDRALPVAIEHWRRSSSSGLDWVFWICFVGIAALNGYDAHSRLERLWWSLLVLTTLAGLALALTTSRKPT